MNAAAQPHLFKQTGLDSGSLTMLGAIVHQFAEPGDYRGVSLRNNQRDAVFYLKVEEGSPVNQVNIDLTMLASGPEQASSCGCKSGGAGAQNFLLGAKGHAVFHVSGGPGGYALHIGRSAQEPQPREFDSIELKGGDLFAVTFLRPGVYSVRNLASKERSKASLEIDVAYPQAGKTPYQPPQALRIECVREGFRPGGKAELQALQGCIFVCQAAARIKAELVRPHEPPA
ncbi:MAG: hypothetical protein ACRD22_12885 [Terriglobia bacterium]